MTFFLLASIMTTSAELPLALAPKALAPAALDYTSSFQKRSARVRTAMLNFNLSTPFSTLVPPNTTPFDLYEKQVLRGLSGPMADPASLSVGLAIYAAVTVLVARAPEPIRAIFDGPARLGPAILRDGGFGAGFGYNW